MTQPKDVRRRAGLNAELIVAAATRLSEGTGLDSWTQRDLAAELDVAASVLYHHIGGRDRVIRGVVERVVAQFPVPDADLPWQDWFRALLYPARPLLLRYPGTAKWLLMHGPAFPVVTRTFDSGIGALQRAGFAQPAFVYGAIVNTAMLTVSMRDDRLAVAGDGPRDHAAMLRDFTPLRESSAGIAAVIDQLISPLVANDSLMDTHERYYRFVVESMLAGVERIADSR